MNHLEDIRVLIWDFDGTFYKPNPELWHAVRLAEYKTIANHTGWDMTRVEKEFTLLYKKVYESATQTAAVLSGISIASAAVEMEQYFDRRDFLKKDQKLINMFANLRNFQHYILANGKIERHRETLKVLGVSFSTFVEDVTSETVGVTKPDPKGFMYIMEKSGLPASAHLMIGDREQIDLVPANKLGMKTCLVWSDKKSDIADITLRSVYDILL